jgi:hypothetical protein
MTPKKQCEACGRQRAAVSFIVGISVGAHGIWAARFSGTCGLCRAAANRRASKKAGEKRA